MAANNTSKAFSLLELLLAVSVISLLLVSALNFYRQNQFQQQIRYLKNNADQLGQALNLYYHLICSESLRPPTPGFLFPVTFEALKQTGVLQTNALKNVAWANFQMSIRTNSQGDNYILVVLATINQPAYIIDYIRGQVQGLSDSKIIADKNTIVWIYLPSQKPVNMQDSNWIGAAGLEAFKKSVGVPPQKYCYY